MRGGGGSPGGEGRGVTLGDLPAELIFQRRCGQGRQSVVTSSQGPYTPFADGTPAVNDYIYGGARYLVGLVARF